MIRDPAGQLQRFRRLNAPHLLAKVYAGVRYVDGVEATRRSPPDAKVHTS